MNEDLEDKEKNLSTLKSEIQQMQRDNTHGAKKPHKLVMQLAVIDLFDKGNLKENKIYFNHDLIESFANIFNLIHARGDWNQPAPPFFHLRTSKFWHHQIKPNREIQYSKLTTSGGGTRRILDNIEYAYFSNYCYAVMSDKESRQEFREFLVSALNPYANFTDPAPVTPLISKKRGRP
jgi:predicted restriction endonuclease